MAGAAVALHRARPDQLAGLFIERHQRGLLAAGCADEPVVVDQRRLTVAPRVPLLAAKLGLEIDAEPLLAVGRRAGDELAVGGDYIDHVAIDRGCAPRTLPRLRPLRPRLARLRLPDLLARLAVETGEVFVLVGGGGKSVAERVDPRPGNRRAGIAPARAGGLPDEPGARGRPRFQEVGVGGDGGPFSPAKRGPVGGSGWLLERRLYQQQRKRHQGSHRTAPAAGDTASRMTQHHRAGHVDRDHGKRLLEWAGSTGKGRGWISFRSTY